MLGMNEIGDLHGSITKNGIDCWRAGVLPCNIPFLADLAPCGGVQRLAAATHAPARHSQEPAACAPNCDILDIHHMILAKESGAVAFSILLC
jgi:hypothetical protein